MYGLLLNLVRKSSGGRQPKCKDCRKEYYDTNREHIVKKSNNHYYAKHEENKNKRREYYNINRGEIIRKQKESYHLNRDNITAVTLKLELPKIDVTSSSQKWFGFHLFSLKQIHLKILFKWKVTLKYFYQTETIGSTKK
jgi:hypothetical protein